MLDASNASSLTIRIVIGMILGVALGLLLKSCEHYVWVQEWIVHGFLDVIGRLFVASLKMLVVPLVFVSLVVGVCGLEDVSRLGALGLKTFTLYLLTTSLALVIAIFLATLFQPGSGFDLTSVTAFSSQQAPPFKEVIISLVPTNPIKAAAEGNMLQVIVFSLLFGIGLFMVKSKSPTVLRIFEEVSLIFMQVVTLLFKLVPYGVFALVAKVFASQGFAAFAPLLSYLGVVLMALACQLLFVYPSMLFLLTRLSPLPLLIKFRSTMMFAASTSSSNATLPLSLKAVTERLGVAKSIASFTMPLGATINMDGTAIMQGVATAFIAQAYGIELGMSGYATVVATATLASIGTAGVPGVGMIMLAMVLKQVGLPVEGIGLIIGVDRVIDMLRTAVNVCGDATVSCIVAHSERYFDAEGYNNLKV